MQGIPILCPIRHLARAGENIYYAPVKHNANIYTAALILFLGGVGYLFYSGISSGSAYFVRVAEAKKMAPEKLSAVRLSGMVKAEHIEKSENPVQIRFSLQDLEDVAQSVPVIYTGVVPDGFKIGAEVTVEGKWSEKDKAFAVHTMTTKCPSKYKKEKRT